MSKTVPSKEMPKTKSLTKLRSSLRLLKLYSLVSLFTRSIPLMFTKIYLSPSMFNEKKVNECMHVCMIMLKNEENIMRLGP